MVGIAGIVLAGGLSVYWPGDGHNAGQLACGGTFAPGQHHIAIRQWRGRCGRPAAVCAAATQKCAWTTIRDSGPWGAVRDARRDTRGAVSLGRRVGRGKPTMWEVQIKLKPGWRRRGVVDLTKPLWEELGRPPFLSEVIVWVP